MITPKVGRRELIASVAALGIGRYVPIPVAAQSLERTDPNPLQERLRAIRPPAAATPSQFRFWHVETLLNQTADLLDRCLMEQSRYHALSALAFNQREALAREEAELQLLEERNQTGLYLWPRNDASLKVSRLDDLAPSVNLVATQVDVIEQWYNSRASSSQAEKARAAADSHLQRIASVRFELERELARLEKERASEKIETLQTEQLIKARERLDSRRTALDSNGPLDAGTQASHSLERIVSDYTDAVNRIRVTSTGLKTIYGYSESIDTFSAAMERVAEGSPDLNDALQWVRGAIRWLAGFSQSDQTVTIAISLRRVLGSRWDDFVSARVTPFRLDETLFRGLRYVRLRGLSASLSSNAASNVAPVRCRFALPSQAEISQVDQTGATTTNLVDQSRMPVCILGKVHDVRVPQPAEVCGAVSLMNASPVGVPGDSGLWRGSLEAITSVAPSSVEDVVLELRVAAQPI